MCTKVYTSAVVLINVHLRIYISIVILTHLEVFVNTFLGTYACLYSARFVNGLIVKGITNVKKMQKKNLDYA